MPRLEHLFNGFSDPSDKLRTARRFPLTSTALSTGSGGNDNS